MEYFKSLFGKASACEGSVVLAYPLGYVGRLNNLRPPHGIMGYGTSWILEVASEKSNYLSIMPLNQLKEGDGHRGTDRALHDRRDGRRA